jgi:hypothetical protein
VLEMWRAEAVQRLEIELGFYRAVDMELVHAPTSKLACDFYRRVKISKGWLGHEEVACFHTHRDKRIGGRTDAEFSTCWWHQRRRLTIECFVARAVWAVLASGVGNSRSKLSALTRQRERQVIKMPLNMEYGDHHARNLAENLVTQLSIRLLATIIKKRTYTHITRSRHFWLLGMHVWSRLF